MSFSSDLSFQWLCITSGDCHPLSNNGLEMHLTMHNYAHLCRNMFGFSLLWLLVSGAGIPIFLHLQHCTNTQKSSVRRQNRKKMWLNVKKTAPRTQTKTLSSKLNFLCLGRPNNLRKTYQCVYSQLCVKDKRPSLKSTNLKHRVNVQRWRANGVRNETDSFFKFLPAC